MAITLVDVGTTANDGTGDPLRTAFQTVNTALTRLDDTVDVQTGYVLLKDDGGTAGVAVTTAGFVGVGTVSPSRLFHVNSTVNEAVRLTTDQTYCLAEFIDSTATVVSVGTVLGDFIVRVDSANQLQYSRSASAWVFRNGGVESMRINSAGNVGVGTTSPTEALDVNSDAIRVRTSQTPASASATGDAGQICWDTNYIYVCTATNTWKRAALATW